jgi:hypothetical protein
MEQQVAQNAADWSSSLTGTLQLVLTCELADSVFCRQLLALMETGGSAEAALRHERQHRAEAEASVLAMESQYETARKQGLTTSQSLGQFRRPRDYCPPSQCSH